MKTIWKQELIAGVGKQTFRLPHNSHILYLAMQDSVPCIWFLTDPESEPCDWTFTTVGTGHYIENYGLEDDLNLDYIGSYQFEGFVGHVFTTWEY